MPNRFVLLLTLFAAVAQACSSNIPEATWSRIADKNTASVEQWTRHDEGEYILSIVVPDGWETYNTAAGIVLNELIGGNAPDTPLHGFLIHIFVPYKKSFDLPAASADVNLAWFVLKQVVHNRDYVGDALISEPVAFEWDGHDAAYYLLNNRDGTVTMLLAMGMPDRRNLVVIHVSVPENQAERVRRLLPDLLATLTIDGQRMDAAALGDLPDPLAFPAE